MIAAPIPSHESARLAALHRLQLLNTGPEPAFDELAQLAAYVCRTPIAVISLVDASRQWFKAVVGLPYTESPRSIAFCAHTILGTTPFIVEEADADERFHDHPWVIEPPAVCFYAGVPLLTREGHAIGSLAVMDVVPRSLTPEQRAAMQTLAKQVMAQCELREKSVLQPAGARVDGLEHPQVEEVLRGSEERFRAAYRNATVGMSIADLNGQLREVNQTLCTILGYSERELLTRTFQSLTHPEDLGKNLERVQHLLAGATSCDVFEKRYLRKDGGIVWAQVGLSVIRDEAGHPTHTLAMVQDITERKRAEGALQKSEERFQFAIEATSDGLWDWDIPTGVVHFSPQWIRLLGYLPEEVAPSTAFFFAILHPEDEPRMTEVLQAHLDGRTPLKELEIRLRQKSGEYRWYLDRGKVVMRDQAGHPLRMIGTITDITERKQVEQERAEALGNLQTIMETVPDVIFALDLEGRLSKWNRRMETVTGYAHDELQGKSALDMVPPDEGMKTAAAITKAFEAGYAELEGHLLAKDGRTILYHWTGTPYTDMQGQVIGITGVGRDITERKHFEEALRHSEERYRRYFELGLIGMAVTSLEKGWVQVNDRLCEIFGYSRDELRAKTWTELTHPDDIAPDLARFNRVLAGDIDGYSLDKRFLHKDGHIIYASISARAVRRADGSIDHFVAFVQDITARKTTEQLLSGEKRILELIGSNTPLPDILTEVCWMIEGVIPGVSCSVLLLDKEGAHLRHGAAPSLPESYVRAIDGMAIGPSRGSCGTAAFTGGQVVVEDIASHPFWDEFRHIALPHGLRSCWSSPILTAGGQVVGTFAIYNRPASCVLDELPIVDRASHLACLAIERKQTEQALRLTQFSIQHAVDAVFWIDAQARILDVNHAACTILGYSREELLSKTVHDIDPNFPPEAWAAHWEDLKARRSFSFETDHRRKDGTTIQTETTVNYLVHEGREFNCAFMHDITERKRAEAQLHLTQFAIERAADMVFWVAPSSRLMLVNAAACERLGYSKEELLRMAISDIDPNYQREGWARHWEELRQAGRLRFETQHRSKSGDVYPVEVVANFLVFDGKEYNFATVRDISDRKRAEEALRMTRFSVERVSDSIFWIDSAARIVDVNEAACRILQYSRQELLSRHLFDIDQNVTADNWSRLWQDKLQQRTMTFESSQIRKDGTVFPVEITCNYLRFGEQEFCCAIQRDISERKHAEAMLRFSEERFRLVAEATNDILWDWNLVTHEHWWSPNAQEKFGYDPAAEPSITAWTDRLHPEDRDRVIALVDRALASDAKTAAAEYRFRLADGSYGHFYDRGQIIRDSVGRAVRMVGAMIDVTFSKRAYASLEDAYRRLQSMSRELQMVESNERRRLSRELHDEVGQLLTALKFDLEAVRQAMRVGTASANGRAQERTIRALETTDELFVRLRRVVRALRPPVLEELGLKAALEALVSDTKSRSDLVCAVSIEGEAVDSVEAATIEAALYRMTQELVTNVVRHAQAMTLTVILDVDARQWKLTVQDDGLGFDPKHESISGMGIRGIRERAEILGGHVDVSSQPGAGTTVMVCIPAPAAGILNEGMNDM